MVHQYGKKWRQENHPIVIIGCLASSFWTLLVVFCLCYAMRQYISHSEAETGSWKWPLLQLIAMTGLAYVCALVV